MRIPRIYTPQPLAPGREIALAPQPSHHLVKVLRMSAGRPVKLFNGDGHEYAATIVRADKKGVTVLPADAVYRPNNSPLSTELAMGLSKGDRLDWVLQKATELGVSGIAPLFTERCDVRLPDDKLDRKMASWNNIISAACEQCQRNTLPTLKRPQPLRDFITACAAEAKYVLHHRGERGLAATPRPASLALLVGPEGGLTNEEIALAQQHGFAPLRLGGRVLRTETAPLAALSIVQYLWGDLAL